MATGLFNRHGRSADDQAAVADERAAEERERADATSGTGGIAGRVMGRRRHPLASNQPVPPGGAVAPPPERTAIERTAIERTGTERTGTEAERADQAERERAEAQREAEAARARVRRARTSFAATLSLIVGVCAVLAALSGRLAPVAVGLGVVGLLFAIPGGVAVSRRRHVTGHHVALLGLLFSVVGLVFGILAINKSVPWLNGDADQASQLRAWLDSHWSWLKRW
jgi:hypothetical protein